MGPRRFTIEMLSDNPDGALEALSGGGARAGSKRVTFRTKNGKSVTVDPIEFLSRFVEHVLPARFVKIRHYGLLAPAHVATSLAAARAALRCTTPVRRTIPTTTGPAPAAWQALLLELTGIDVGVCRACGARAVERQTLPVARAPPEAA